MNENLSNSFIRKYLASPRLVFLVLLLVITIGVNAYLTLPRTLNPEIKIPIVLISTALPGGSPGDVEQLVTIPLEDATRNVTKVKSVTSTSRESVSVIQIEFESGIDPEKARSDIKSVVDSVTTLPDDATTPNVQKLDFENQPTWTFALTSSLDNGSLFNFAEVLETKLKDLPEVDRVQISGVEATEVEVTIKPETFLAHNVNPLTLSQLVKASLSSFPAGAVKTAQGSFALSIDPLITKVDDIRNLRVNLNGQNVKLADIAVVSEHPKPDQSQSFLAKSGQPIKRSLTFDVYRSSSVNIDQSVRAAESLVDGEIENHPRFEVTSVLNTAKEIDDQFNELVRDFSITVALVVLVLFIFLGLRQAIVSAMSAPLTFLIAFAVMKATGLSLNFLSLFSLLLALGLLVDDTVVIISATAAYHRKRATGQTPLQTGLLVWRDFLIPVFTTTITTIWAFLPLLLSTGIIGEFIKSIPVVVSTALIGSFFVSIFIILPTVVFLLENQLPKRVRILIKVLFGVGLIGFFAVLVPKNNNLLLLEILAFLVFLFVVVQTQVILLSRIRGRLHFDFSWREKLENGLISFEKIDRSYRQTIFKIIDNGNNRKKTIAMVLIFSIFSFLLFPLGFVKQEFFPAADSELIYLSLEMPAGTNLEAAKHETMRLLTDLNQTPHIETITADIGRGFSTDSGIAAASFENVLFTLRLLPAEERISSIEIAQKLRNKYKSYKKGTLTIQEISGGPPVGADIQIKLLGDDLTKLEGYAKKTEDYLKIQQGVTNVDQSIKPGTSKITFDPDLGVLAENNITLDQIGLQMRLFASGFNLDKDKLGTSKEKDITLRLYSKTPQVADLSTLMIPSQNGSLPLNSLGKFSLEPNPTLIAREDGKRTISVSGTTVAGYNTQTINQDIEKFADGLNLPPGYSWKTGGVNEQNDQSVQSILQAMLLSFLLIIITMVIQFASFRRALIVMLVIPLSVSGVFIIFALFNIPLSFPALIGILALFGIVVKNSILVVDKIVKNEKAGMEFKEAIADASASRLEPIALTSFCTIIGLIPITLSDPLWRGLGGAIIAGLTFSGTIMLFFIPVVYFLIFNKDQKTRTK